MGFGVDSQLAWSKGVFSKAPFLAFLDTNSVKGMDGQLSGGKAESFARIQLVFRSRPKLIHNKRSSWIDGKTV